MSSIENTEMPKMENTLEVIQKGGGGATDYAPAVYGSMTEQKAVGVDADGNFNNSIAYNLKAAQALRGGSRRRRSGKKSSKKSKKNSKKNKTNKKKGGKKGGSRRSKK